MKLNDLMNKSSYKKITRGLCDDLFLFIMEYNYRVVRYGLLSDNDDGVMALDVSLNDDYCTQLFVSFYDAISNAYDYDSIKAFLDARVLCFVSSGNLSDDQILRLTVFDVLLRKSMSGSGQRCIDNVLWIADFSNPLVTYDTYNSCQHYCELINDSIKRKDVL